MSDIEQTNRLRFSEVMGTLLGRIPPTAVVWQTMSGNITAEEMRSLIESRHMEGLQWLSDHLRVIRDVEARRKSYGRRQKGIAAPTEEFMAMAKAMDKKAFKQLVAEHPAGNLTISKIAACAISKDRLLEELAANSDIAAEYVALYLQRMDEYLKSRKT